MPTAVNSGTDRERELPWRSFRENQGLTLRETARQAGMHVSQLSRFERGQADISTERLARLAHVLGLRELDRLLAPYRNDPRKALRARAAREGAGTRELT